MATMTDNASSADWVELHGDSSTDIDIGFLGLLTVKAEPVDEGQFVDELEAVSSPYEPEQKAGNMTRSEIETQIAQYEEQFGMSSEEFLQQMEEGRTPDSFEAIDWAILLKHR